MRKEVYTLSYPERFMKELSTKIIKPAYPFTNNLEFIIKVVRAVVGKGDFNREDFTL